MSIYIYIYGHSFFCLSVCLFLGSPTPNVGLELTNLRSSTACCTDWASWAPLHAHAFVCICVFYIYVSHTHISHIYADERLYAEEYIIIIIYSRNRIYYMGLYPICISMGVCVCLGTFAPSNPYENSLQLLTYEQDDKHTQRQKECHKHWFFIWALVLKYWMVSVIFLCISCTPGHLVLTQRIIACPRKLISGGCLLFL